MKGGYASKKSRGKDPRPWDLGPLTKKILAALIKIIFENSKLYIGLDLFEI